MFAQRRVLSRSPSNGDRRFVRVRMFTNNRLRFTSSGRRCLAVVVVPDQPCRGVVAGVEVFRRREFTIEWLRKVIIKSTSRQPTASLVAQLPSNQIHGFFHIFSRPSEKRFSTSPAFHSCITFHSVNSSARSRVNSALTQTQSQPSSAVPTTNVHELWICKSE